MENTVNFKREQPNLSIIVVSYNTADLIGNCLKSVFAASNITKEIFVVDNASTDGSVTLIKKNFPAVYLIANMENRGFAAANNQMLPQCKGKYIFFLNPDTEVVPDTFSKAISFMDANSHIGLAGTKIINPDGTLQWSVSYKYPGQKHTTNELSELPGNIACVLGASMIARSELVKKIGGFDEDFFLYGEDQDLCLRIRKLGYEIGYIDSATVVHLGGQSEKNSLSSEVWKKKIRAEYIFYRKHYLPKTIKRISRANIIKAWWRIITLKLFMPLAKDKTIAREKLGKYQVIYHEAKK
ncbi:MAG: glycosyltransferase family 2 protein [Desulfobacteraceae bacterium]|uniref:Glycosyltransferase family 2 protein n=1 Tax=Candidatus Desulfaltia bathyphila TaxID=2841697 RepID=A0A8J6T6I3_9BACT|nr:glycosyltransferase family 2 protein [Candidatus Desulfaltia bathyphila]MBL7196213.1 glycosyltransferase family 2 protein [Desulfobacterales bacterium]